MRNYMQMSNHLQQWTLSSSAYPYRQPVTCSINQDFSELYLPAGASHIRCSSRHTVTDLRLWCPAVGAGRKDLVQSKLPPPAQHHNQLHRKLLAASRFNNCRDNDINLRVTSGHKVTVTGGQKVHARPGPSNRPYLALPARLLHNALFKPQTPRLFL
ncbi:hypothetical protein RRG08_063617 [Elysia crispata]|uniref:Uncharacterized protein n=1 Tax=Elysia crispata TaxID=231223 RepID=A0AAE1AJW0_9GAST|nr:hypothetical protein RRG08_063617 [Elysia crispata]